LIALVALSTTSFKPASAYWQQTNNSAARSAPELSAERIRGHVEFLASDKLQGRRTGTPAADEAANYIAAQFRSYGLKTELQPFSFVSKVELGKQNEFKIKTSSVARALKVGEEFMPLAFSPSQRAEGEVVFVGYGISAPEQQYDNYAGADVKGKLVMVLRGSPDGDNPHGRFAAFTQPGLEIQNKTLKAREKGASGVIFVSAESVFQHDRLSRLRHDLNFLDSNIPTVVVSREAAEAMLAAGNVSLADTELKLKEKPEARATGARAEFKTDVVKVNGTGSNVVAILKGSDPQLSSEYIAIGAHYDHLGLGGTESLAANPEGSIHHGADDNASGTSALIEMARVLSAEKAKVRRSIVFLAFSGEEMGLLGSAAYTKNPAAPIASTVAMLNMDMVGRLRDGKLFVGGVGTSPLWKPLLDKLNAGAGSSFQMSYGQDGFGPSDHQSFYVKDIPVLFFFTGTHDDYHKPSDTAEKINAEGVKQIVGMVREVAVAVANEPERIAFTRVKVESRPTGGGFRVYLGTIPNYSDQQDGMKLDGVRPGSPAERAGLKAGDIVVKLAATPIKNVYDYTYALGEMRAGQEVDVVIRRDGREMTLKLTPEKRN
jgi:hypothetical protein